MKIFLDLITPAPSSLLAHAITLVIRATQVDNKDRYALATLVVASKDNVPKINPSPNLNSPPVVSIGPGKQHSQLIFLQPKFETKIREDTLAGTRILGLPTNKPEKHLQYTILDKSQNDFFMIGKLGEVVLKRSLDFEKATRHVSHTKNLQFSVNLK